MNVANIIYEQLGAQKFVAMTGSKNFLRDENNLRMELAKNESKANKLIITLEASDTYKMEFMKYIPGRMTTQMEWVEPKVIMIEEITGAYAEDLQKNFTRVTGMDTHL